MAVEVVAERVVYVLHGTEHVSRKVAGDDFVPDRNVSEPLTSGQYARTLVGPDPFFREGFGGREVVEVLIGCAEEDSDA
ncbi:hypothetical protein QJS04_geneDACA003667 [Acorus gramineus]|uniref:Uncharacterized protein n=1 Tax=Acorus gramineus TaxID=55184 RepID=A0AAV9BSB4_ACOGR|nr:hypothetical protein QJS04_geneDACA003667 [Acorus gramineus]